MEKEKNMITLIKYEVEYLNRIKCKKIIQHYYNDKLIFKGEYLNRKRKK